ncbi:TIGR04255 family protein [Synechococcus sp. Cruz CV12-2-Slac-r]|uniref:TIGR04255 family protein n=1 Tax=Synechococcus sp. Cruz CV12-2-Slac-r TaxID=2823748 RepID=UPI0020CF5021|nr:TIGR04255 family protein [Synechococcus sp. Cruz CV12-2-Slac-r]MCP9940733.1 TIGR04255 family protein [Synechococcus sp. Cruz CV12-2-Slac-r]
MRYEKNPLVEVICQLRFPKILKIDNEDPYQFQEAIRNEYPNFSAKRELPLSALLAEPGSQPGGAASSGFVEQIKSFEFVDKTAEWKLVLSSSFLSLSTLRYAKWEEFRERLDVALKAFISIYSPVFLTRIGLRYQDLIVKSELGLEESPWHELVKPHILGALSITEFAESDLTEALLTFGYTLDISGAKISVRSGLALRVGSSEPVCLIDSDCYTDSPVEIADALLTLDEFNAESRNFFNWAITPKLRESLSPKSI